MIEVQNERPSEFAESTRNPSVNYLNECSFAGFVPGDGAERAAASRYNCSLSRSCPHAASIS